MAVLSDARQFVRFAFDAKAFLRQPMTVDEATAHIRERMRLRDGAFLHVVEHAIYGLPRSPYRRLLEAAGCELGDVQNMVRHDGVEDALRQLCGAGVSVSLEEFKGRSPAKRGSQTFHLHAADFDSPFVGAHFRGQTGGSRGPSTTVRFNLDHIAQTTPHWAAWFAAHQWSGRPLVFWTSVFAAVANGQLRYAKLGARLIKWFSMGTGGTWSDRLTASAVNGALRWAAGFPAPEFVPLDRAEIVADYLDGLQRDRIKPLVNTSASAAARISLAAQERGDSLGHVAFLLRGEPLTVARRAAIEASGASAVQTYGFAEGGTVGSQCPCPTTADDIHVYRDAFAVLTRPLMVSDGQQVPVLLLTALRPACPKIMLNTEIGDHAVVETRACGCLFDRLGYTQHLHSVRSFEKFTGEGVTILGSDIASILESVLPAKFGGHVTDYQLVEEQNGRSLPRYQLLVSPEIGPVDERALAQTFLHELRKKQRAYRLMAGLWVQADVLRVRRERPRPSVRGKVLPFRTLNLSETPTRSHDASTSS